MAEKYTPGYIEVPGKGMRYRTANGEYFDNHFGAIVNSITGVGRKAGDAYNNYYNSVADSVGTERRDGSVKPSDTSGKEPKTEKPGAPAKPADSTKTYTVSGVTYDSATGRPVNSPEGGYSVSSGGEITPHTSNGARINANGLKSYGRDLSSLNQFTKDFTGGYEIADISTAFQSEDLPVKGSKGTNTDYSLEDAEAMGVSKEDALTISEGGFVETLITPSTPGTTGNNPANAQDGTSDKPDIAENVRTIRMQRKGPRDDGSFRGFQKDNNNALAQMPKAEEPDAGKIAQEKRRNAIRSTFLDTSMGSVKASVAANALAGYGKDSDGNAQFNYGGELVQAKDGMQQQAKNAAMMGQDPSQYLDIPATADTQPDTPAASELSMTAPIKDMSEADQKKAAQQFAKGFVSDISSKLKNK